MAARMMSKAVWVQEINLSSIYMTIYRNHIPFIITGYDFR